MFKYLIIFLLMAFIGCKNTIQKESLGDQDNYISNSIKRASFVTKSTTANEIIYENTLQEENYNLTERLGLDGNTYDSIKLQEGFISGNPGEPQIPEWRQDFMVPNGANFEIEIISKNEQLLSNQYNIIPKEENPAGEANPIFVKDVRIYAKDSFIPDTPIKILNKKTLRGQDYIVITYAPFAYNPKLKQIKIISSVIWKLKLVSHTDPKFLPQQPYNSSLQVFKNIENEALKAFIINSKTLVKEAPPEGYVIITHPDFNTAAQNLASWKRKKGLNVVLYNINEITSATDPGQQAIDIRNKLKAERVDLNLHWVLLMGMHNQVPAFMLNQLGTRYLTITSNNNYLDLLLGSTPFTATFNIGSYPDVDGFLKAIETGLNKNISGYKFNVLRDRDYFKIIETSSTNKQFSILWKSGTNGTLPGKSNKNIGVMLGGCGANDTTPDNCNTGDGFSFDYTPMTSQDIQLFEGDIYGSATSPCKNYTTKDACGANKPTCKWFGGDKGCRTMGNFLGYKLHYEGYMHTDYYYSVLDDIEVPENNLQAYAFSIDVMVGRIPCKTLSECMTVVGKTIDYEKNPPNNDWFYKRAVLMADFHNDKSENIYKSQRSMHETVIAVRDYLTTTQASNDFVKAIVTPRSQTIWINENDDLEWSDYLPSNPPRENSTGHLYIPNNQKVPFTSNEGEGWGRDSTKTAISYINFGSWLFLIRAHGASAGHSMPYFSIGGDGNAAGTISYNTIAQLSNRANAYGTNIFPLVMHLGCTTNPYDYETSIVREWLIRYDGGSIAALGNSRQSGTPNGDYFTYFFMSCLKGDFFSTLKRPNLGYSPTLQVTNITDVSSVEKNIGSLIICARTQYSTQYDSSIKAMTLLNLSGDPEFYFHTSRPQLINVRNSEYIREGGSFWVETDASFANVVMADGNGYQLKKTDEHGMAYFNFPSSRAGQHLPLTITAPGRIPVDREVWFAMDNTPPAAVVLSHPNSFFKASFNVTITGGGDANFKEYRYTLDGSNPTCAFGNIGGSVLISNATTIFKAIACDKAGNSSFIAGATYTFDNTLPTAVTLSHPANITFNAAFTATLQGGTDANFKEYRYTLGGSNPTCSSGNIGGSVLIPNATTILKAIACDNAGNSSPIVGVQYTFDNTQPSTVFLSHSNRTFGVAFTVTITGGADSNFKEYRYTTTGSNPTCSSGNIGSTVTIPRATTILKAIACDKAGNSSFIAGATYTFYDSTLPESPALSPTSRHFISSLSISIYLGLDVNFKEYRYTTDGTLPTCSSGNIGNSLVVQNATTTVIAIACDTSGNSSSPISRTYTFDNTPPTSVVFSPAIRTSNASFTVRLTEGVDVNRKEFRYTTNTKNPTCSYGNIGSVVTIPGYTTTLKAIACDFAGNSSPVASATYALDNTAPQTVILRYPNSFFKASFTLTIAGGTDTNFKEYRYTTNGTTPTCSSGNIGNSVTIPNATTTLKAIACDFVGNSSPVASATYTFDKTPPAPVALYPTNRTFNASFEVKFMGGVDVNFKEYRYTTNGSNPTCFSGNIGKTVMIPKATTTLKVIACDFAGNSSSIAMAAYTYIPIR